MDNSAYSWVSPMTGKVYADDFGLSECTVCHEVGHESEFFEYELCSNECKNAFLLNSEDY